MEVYLHHIVEKYLERLNEADRSRIKPLYTIEPASPEECNMVEKRVREYHKNPSSFVPLKSIK